MSSRAVCPSLREALNHRRAGMAEVYRVAPDGTTPKMARIHCDNEDRELQQLSEKNFDLMPRAQIEPDEPRQRMSVKPKMPVPYPSTGLNRWRVEFLLVNQDSAPTFVHRQRFTDTRGRSEIIARRDRPVFTARRGRSFAAPRSTGRRSRAPEFVRSGSGAPARSLFRTVPPQQPSHRGSA